MDEGDEVTAHLSPGNRDGEMAKLGSYRVVARHHLFSFLPAVDPKHTHSFQQAKEALLPRI